MYQRHEPKRDDLTEFVKDEKILMNDPLFSEKTIWGYNIRVEAPFTPKRVHNYKLISMIWVEKQTISNHQEKWRNEMEIC